MLATLSRITAAYLLCCLAHGQDQDCAWVDPVYGDDATGGPSSGLPFQTIQAAADWIEGMPAQGERQVVLRPGVYSSTDGQPFPIRLQPSTRLIGEQGAQHTILRSPGGGLLVFSDTQGNQVQGYVKGICFDGVQSNSSPNQIGIRAWDAGVYLKGCTIENLTIGLMSGPSRLEDCVIEDTPVGLQFFSGTSTVTGCLFIGSENPDFVSSVGIRLNISGTAASCFVYDTTFLRWGSAIQAVLNGYEDAEFEIRANRSRFKNNISALNPFTTIQGQGTTHTGVLEATDSLFVGNMASIRNNVEGSVERSLNGCTLDGQDLSASPVTPSSGPVSMFSCVSVGHLTHDDGGMAPTHSYLETSIYAGAISNLTGTNPGFRDSAAGDYRLYSNSVCVDQGSEHGSDADLDGLPRRVDGRLDGNLLVDMGAFELQTLQVPAEVTLGTIYAVTLNGPPGFGYHLLLSRTGLSPTTTSTPFGSLQLPTVTSTRLLQGTYPQSGSVNHRFTSPGDASLVGNTYAFQALAYEPGTGRPPRLTQAAEFVVTNN